MANPTLAVRLGILGTIIFGAVAVIATVLAIMFFVGLATLTVTSLAVGLLLFVTLAAGIGLAVGMGAGFIVAALLTLAIFIVASIVAGPALALIAALLFLILLGLVLLVAGTSPNISTTILVLALLLVPVAALLSGLFGPGATLVVLAVLGYILLGLFGVWLATNVHRMPIELLGLGGLSSMPAIPLPTLIDFVDAGAKLLQKQEQRKAPIDALTNIFTLRANTVHARTDDGRTFLFGGTGRDDAAAMQYSLDAPDQFDMGWTTYDQIDARAAALSAGVPATPTAPAIPGFRDALTDATVGTRMFWTNIARYWNPFGVMPIRLVTASDVAFLRARFGAEWVDPPMQQMIRDRTLFMLDMTIFELMDPPTASSSPRFSPSTLTLFELDAPNATFIPFLIRVSDGRNAQVYCGPLIPVVTGFAPPSFTPTVASTPGAWLYALQALKASTTCWGIWLGHVYRYHIVSTAMQMTMYQRLPPLHPVRQILGRQSKHTIGFDAVLLTDWSFPPPTSCGTSIEFLQLIDVFAGGRTFFADDPEIALGIQFPAPPPPLPTVKDTLSNPAFMPADINLPVFAAVLRPEMPPTPAGADPVAFRIGASLSSNTLGLLADYNGGDDPRLLDALVTDLNVLTFATPTPGVPPTTLPLRTATGAVPGFTMHPDTAAEFSALTPGREPILNRMLLQDAYPASISIMQWNRYPVAHYVVSIHRIATRYVAALMAAIYPLGPASPVDPRTQAWLNASMTEGNVQLAGIPPVGATVGQLTGILTSLIYRITAHGMARLAPVGNPGLSWVGNFPPCLEDSRLPDPANPAGTPTPSDLTPQQLLAFLPKTGTIGEMISFIFSFGFTDNFEPLIPVPSANTTGMTNYEIFPFHLLPTACDTALATCRAEMIGFMRHFIADQNRQNAPAAMNFSATAAQIHQWELSIEQ